jgi:hypothetical protein
MYELSYFNNRFSSFNFAPSNLKRDDDKNIYNQWRTKVWSFRR